MKSERLEVTEWNSALKYSFIFYYVYSALSGSFKHSSGVLIEPLHIESHVFLFIKLFFAYPFINVYILRQCFQNRLISKSLYSWGLLRPQYLLHFQKTATNGVSYHPSFKWCWARKPGPLPCWASTLSAKWHSQSLNHAEE